MPYLTKKQKIFIKKLLFNNQTLISFVSEPKYFIANKIWAIGRKITRNSIFNRKSEIGMCSLLPAKILEQTISLFHPKTILDLGCGTGKSLDFFLSKKIVAIGVEGSSLAKKQSLSPEFIKTYNLNNELNLNEQFDLIWSFEFVEHIHPKYTDNLMRTFSNHSNTVVLSAARPGQGGEGHFNEQNDEYWIKQFKKYNFELDKPNTEKLRLIDEQFSKNMYVFRRN